jgi:hypothetical protein
VYEDRTLTCRDCGDGFIFSGGEQRFFAEKGLVNVPSAVRLPGERETRAHGRSPRYHAAVCNSVATRRWCPSRRARDRPVYCSTCFDKVRAGTITPAAAPVSS